MAISVFHNGVVWVTDTHREAGSPRSPPHEADTVALEDSPEKVIPVHPTPSKMVVVG